MQTAILTQAFGLPRDKCHLRCEGLCHRAIPCPTLVSRRFPGYPRLGNLCEFLHSGRRRHFAPGTQPAGSLVLVLSLAAHRNRGHSSRGRGFFEPTALPVTRLAAGPSSQFPISFCVSFLTLLFLISVFWIGARVVAALSTTDQMQMKICGGDGLQNFNVWIRGET